MREIAYRLPQVERRHSTNLVLAEALEATRSSGRRRAPARSSVRWPAPGGATAAPHCRSYSDRRAHASSVLPIPWLPTRHASIDPWSLSFPHSIFQILFVPADASKYFLPTCLSPTPA